MIQKQTDKGVSPVIGVILMVAITVIIAAVVANFVLDLGGTLQEDADATVSFDQDANYGTSDYSVTVTTTNMDNADYTYVQLAGGDLESQYDVEQQVSDSSLLDEEVAEGDRGVAMVQSGDRIVIDELDGDEDLQVFGVLSGDSTQVTSYSVEDPQRFMSDSGTDDGTDDGGE